MEDARLPYRGRHRGLSFPDRDFNDCLHVTTRVGRHLRLAAETPWVLLDRSPWLRGPLPEQELGALRGSSGDR